MLFEDFDGTSLVEVDEPGEDFETRTVFFFAGVFEPLVPGPTLCFFAGLTALFVLFGSDRLPAFGSGLVAVPGRGPAGAS